MANLMRTYLSAMVNTFNMSWLSQVKQSRIQINPFHTRADKNISCFLEFYMWFVFVLIGWHPLHIVNVNENAIRMNYEPALNKHYSTHNSNWCDDKFCFFWEFHYNNKKYVRSTIIQLNNFNKMYLLQLICKQKRASTKKKRNLTKRNKFSK